MIVSARYGTNAPASIGVEVTPPHNAVPAVRLYDPEGERFALYLDENHAQALVLALQAAIAEVQARAVQR